MANVEKWGKFLHFIKENYGTIENYLNEQKKSTASSYNSGYSNGVKNGAIKGVLGTTGVGVLMFVAFNLPQWIEDYKARKKATETTVKDVVTDKESVHLFKHMSQVEKECTPSGELTDGEEKMVLNAIRDELIAEEEANNV